MSGINAVMSAASRRCSRVLDETVKLNDFFVDPLKVVVIPISTERSYFYLKRDKQLGTVASKDDCENQSFISRYEEKIYWKMAQLWADMETSSNRITVAVVAWINVLLIRVSWMESSLTSFPSQNRLTRLMKQAEDLIQARKREDATVPLGEKPPVENASIDIKPKKEQKKKGYNVSGKRIVSHSCVKVQNARDANFVGVANSGATTSTGVSTDNSSGLGIGTGVGIDTISGPLDHGTARLASNRLRSAYSTSSRTALNVYYPTAIVDEKTVLKQMEHLYKEGSHTHRNYLLLCILAFPFCLVFSLFPFLPNFPAFYLAYRAYCNYKAYKGARAIESILKRQNNESFRLVNIEQYSEVMAHNVIPTPSVTSCGTSTAVTAETSLSNSPSRSSTSKKNSAQKSKPRMLLDTQNLRVVLDTLKVHGINSDLNKAIKQEKLRIDEEMKKASENKNRKSQRPRQPNSTQSRSSATSKKNTKKQKITNTKVGSKEMQ